MKESASVLFHRIITVFLLPVVLYFGCAGTKPVTETVRFALLGNTSPESPFSGFPKSLPEVLQEIENRKPQIIIHTGDAVYGGSSADGILETDIQRQLNIFFPLLYSLHTAVYTIPGEKDYYNGSTAIYNGYSGKKAGYSFNYGSIHFICLSSSDSGDYFIDEKQLKWLKNDLKEFNDSNAIFVFTHNQLFPDNRKVQVPERKEELHKLFLKYNVKAVFSGAEKDYTVKLKDSIKYINTGCTGTINKKDSKKYFRFYIVNYSENEINIEPVK